MKQITAPTFACVLASCVGAVGQGDLGSEQPPSGAPPAAPAGRGEVPGPGGAPLTPTRPPATLPDGTTCKGVAAPPSRLLRLTRDQYDYVLSDLVGDTSTPGRAFPSDGRVGHFDVALPVDGAVLEAYYDAAEQAAARALSDPKIVSCADGDATCVRRLVSDFGRRAFRRPLQTHEVEEYVGAVYTPVRMGADHKTGVGAALRAILMSPYFLYRVEQARSGATLQELDPYELATRLSFLFWQSIPDITLLNAAATGALATAQGLKAQAQRLLDHANAERGSKAFAAQWLSLENLDNVTRSSPATWTPALRDAMRAETVRFVSTQMKPGRTFADLITSSTSYVNQTLAPIYGLTGVSGTALTERALPANQRAGVLTQASFLATLSDTEQPSPIRRGNWVLEGMLCRAPPPPIDPVPTPPERMAAENTRQYWERFPATCQACHRAMNGIGYAFQSYDAYGRYRTAEPTAAGSSPIDDSGWLDREMKDTFKGVVGLAQKLAGSEEAHRCLARTFYTFAYSQSPSGASGDCAVAALYESFLSGGLQMRELLLGLATSDGFRAMSVQP